ncbi:MAG: alpha-ribazole phosphatase CobZ [Methanomethylovorans sp.]|nr:alpha-ribazole phosphatase CobZ [Methanomethylovorans sp.]
MKLSDIENNEMKKNQSKELEGDVIVDIRDILEEEGITVQMLIDTALELYVPHPGIETREKATEVFLRELDLALSDPNLCLLIYAGILLEKEGLKGHLPSISRKSYERDLTFIIADEVLGMSISRYISGDKGTFEFVRFDKQKPGILSKLGPFMDDVIGGLIGGVSANMYTRGMAEISPNKENKSDKNNKSSDNSGVIAG